MRRSELLQGVRAMKFDWDWDWDWDCPVLVDSLQACGLRLGQGSLPLGFVGHW